jgi:uncharacterized protein YndB with AHSA1/START domain
MNHPQISQPPAAKTGMLIRRPVADVFEAFVDPAVTTRFWFTRSTGKLAEGARVTWFWDMYDVSADVTVKAVEPHRRIQIEWPGQLGVTAVEWLFSPGPGGVTFVEITETGFAGTGDQLVEQVADSTGGFTLVLAGLKALLEHDVQLNLVADRHPAGLGSQ